MTSVRALRIYPKHNQQTAIEFVDYMRARFPFRIHTIQTGNGYDFQTKFHCHCEDLDVQYIYIKPYSPI